MGLRRVGVFTSLGNRLRAALRPGPGRFHVDLIHLVGIATLQLPLLSSLTSYPLAIDFLTCWLVTVFIGLPLLQGLFLALLAGWFVELFLPVPAGLYLCSYWIIASTMYLTRTTLSWRHLSARFAWITGSQVLIVLFEALTILVAYGAESFSLFFWLTALSRCAFSTVFAIFCLKLGLLREEVA
jgi:hypothetical protein